MELVTNQVTSFSKCHCAGPATFNFKQGDTYRTIFGPVSRDFLKDPNAEQIACQVPEPTLAYRHFLPAQALAPSTSSRETPTAPSSGAWCATS